MAARIFKHTKPRSDTIDLYFPLKPSGAECEWWLRPRPVARAARVESSSPANITGSTYTTTRWPSEVGAIAGTYPLGKINKEFSDHNPQSERDAQ